MIGVPVRALVFALFASAAPLCGAALAACGTTAPTVGITPITGIIIRTDTLVRGFGCGAGQTQVYKYVAAVASDDDVSDGGAPAVYQKAAVFDCFADGVFSTIDLPETGDPSFTVTIVAMNKTNFDAQSAKIEAIRQATLKPTPDAIPVATIAALLPTWTTTCHATQQQNVAVLAVCDPLQSTAPVDAGADAPPPTRIQLDTSSVPRADGGAFQCGTDFTSVRSLFDQFPMQTGSVACPMPLVIDPAKPNVTYHLDVFLEKNGAVVAQAKGCTAMVASGMTAAPTCPAFK